MMCNDTSLDVDSLIAGARKILTEAIAEGRHR